jgi:hypothetical protein
VNPFIIGAAVVGGILYLIREEETKETSDSVENEQNNQKVALLQTQEEIRKLRGQLRKAERTKKSLTKNSDTNKK